MPSQMQQWQAAALCLPGLLLRPMPWLHLHLRLALDLDLTLVLGCCPLRLLNHHQQQEGRWRAGILPASCAPLLGCHQPQLGS
jgi:hypothetical protein